MMEFPVIADEGIRTNKDRPLSPSNTAVVIARINIDSLLGVSYYNTC